jgi:predicted Zn-dependent protease
MLGHRGQLYDAVLARQPSSRVANSLYCFLKPINRSQESEADHISLILMAKAGADPREAIGLWERMEAGQRGAGPSEFLSPHPSGATRIKQLQQWMPEALQYYRGPGRP